MNHTQIVDWAHSKFGKSETPGLEGLMAEVVSAALERVK